jgi:hypothetical protein
MAGVKQRHREIIDGLRESGMPEKDEMSLQRQRKSLYCTIMASAWQDAGESLDNPGVVKQYYYPEDGVLVLEFDADE